jgi:hypothetical protein
MTENLIKFETHCKDCIWAKKQMFLTGEGNSCEQNRLEKFGATEVVDGYYKFPRFCNAWRDVGWQEKNKGWEQQRLNTEMKIGMGLIIDFTNNYDLVALEKTLDSVYLGDGFTFPGSTEPNYLVVINDKPEYQSELHKMIEFYVDEPQNRHLIQILSALKEFYMDEAFRFARHGYSTFVYSGDVLPDGYIDRINSLINTELAFFSCAFAEDGKIIFQNSLFKLLGGNKPLLKDDGSVDKRDFVSKLLDMKSDQKCIYLWEELFTQ